MTLLGDDGGVIAAWEQADDGDRLELRRSHDGAVALVVVDEVITAVRLADGQIAAQFRDERGIDAAFPLDGAWTLEIAGELDIDGGHTGFQGGGVGFFWPGLGEPPDKTEIARLRAELSAAARTPVRRRLAVQRNGGTALVHESAAAPVEGGEILLWPPIAGPEGVLLRHAIVTDEGNHHETAPQPPWLVRADGTVTQLVGFELGVSPLLALPGDRWLLPGADALWRDDYDEPLSVLHADGRIEPLRVGGEPVPASRVLREAAPEVLASLEPIDPDQDVPWETVSARLDPGSDELQLAIEIEIDAETDTCTILVASVPLSGEAPMRVVAQSTSTPNSQVALAP